MSDIPPNVDAVLTALRFKNSDCTLLRNLSGQEWDELFRRWEISRLLVPLNERHPHVIPSWVASHIAHNLSDNAKRFERIKEIYGKFRACMQARNAEHLVVKGFGLWPDFIEHPRLRLQSDVDVYCPLTSVPLALDSLSELGYEPIKGMNTAITDHTPTMISIVPWTWRGNPYDPGIPVTFEIHFRFWNEERTRLRVNGLHEFWVRRVKRQIDDFRFVALASPDNVAYTGLNALRDFLQGSPLPIHLIYNLAQFLQKNATNDDFWRQWRQLHDDSLLRLQVISFQLAALCFDCEFHEIIREKVARQPQSLQAWFKHFRSTPFRAQYRPNKEALWLHIAALQSQGDRRAILRQKLFPTRIPSKNANYARKTGDVGTGFAGELRKRWWRTVYLARRARYHVSVLPRTLWQGARLWWCVIGLERLPAEKTLEVELFEGALQKTEARRQKSGASRETASTTTSEK